jgi:hypothetical protein
MREFFDEIGYDISKPSTLYLDNASAIQVAKNPDSYPIPSLHFWRAAVRLGPPSAPRRDWHNMSPPLLRPPMISTGLASCISLIRENYETFEEFIFDVLKVSDSKDDEVIASRDEFLSAAPKVVKLMAEKTDTDEFLAQLVETTVLACKADIPTCVQLVRSLVRQSRTPQLLDAINEIATDTCKEEVKQLVDKRSGFHFNAKNCTHEQIESFRIEVMLEDMRQRAPRLPARERLQSAIGTVSSQR